MVKTTHQRSGFRVELERHIRLACLMEVTARKPGNVHPTASFESLCYNDFVRSAELIAPALAQTAELGVGRAILRAVTATRKTVGRNTNLGIVLLLAPLAAVPPSVSLSAGISDVLDSLTQDDAALAYRAIRLANPGGMGRVSDQNISGEPSGTLLQVMQLAGDRDAVAAQYAGNFDLVLRTGVARLAETDSFAERWHETVIRLHLSMMAHSPDTLIARKRGIEEAQESARLAQQVLDTGWPTTRTGQEKLVQLDRWLREHGNARNPGTTADLVTASLFAAMRDRSIQPPSIDTIHADF